MYLGHLRVEERAEPISCPKDTFFVRRTPPVYTAWEERSLRAQKREYLRQGQYTHRIQRGSEIVRRYLESKAKEKE